MVVFICSARDSQAVVFVLDVTPEQVVQRAQWIDLEIRKGITLRWSAPVLKAHADRVHGLDEHAFFVPVGPNELEHAWATEPVGQQSATELRTLIRINAQRVHYPIQVRQWSIEHAAEVS